MIIEETHLKGCYVIKPKIYVDKRGSFYESYNKSLFEKETGLVTNFVQDNLSKSSKHVLRGLHFQTGEFAQAKLVQVIKGKVLDVCVDLRKNSSSFGKHFSITLDDVNKKQLFIPRGFAHGFLTLEDETLFGYKCDNFYHKNSESGICFNDKFLNINWGVDEKNLIISEKDLILPTFDNVFYR